MRTAILSLAALGLVLAGCTYVNQPLNDAQLALEARRPNATRADLAWGFAPPPTTAPADLDGCFVGLAISGGGSRSANFASACMFQLQKRGLLQRVDCISSVSGGSLPAAYYCLNGADWNPDNVQRRMSQAFASDVIARFLLPWNILAMMTSDYDRSDLLAASFQENLFSRGGRGLTFADLRPDRPRLLINGTDLQSGRRFVFCNDTFDRMNADLGKYPVAYAVAASAAVPVLLHQVTLRDFSIRFPQYRHIIDGGIADNLGVHTLMESYNAQCAACQRAKPGSDPYPNGAVFIVIDARTQFDSRISDRGDISFVEALAAGADLTTTALLSRASSATLAEIIVQNSPDNVSAQTLREQIQALERDGYLALTDRRGRPVRVVHLALSRLRQISNLPFASFSESVNSIATYFNIDPTEAANLYRAADLIIDEPAMRGHLEEVARHLNVLPPPLPSAR